LQTLHICKHFVKCYNNCCWKEKDNAIKQAVEEAVQLERDRAKQTTSDERVSSCRHSFFVLLCLPCLLSVHYCLIILFIEDLVLCVMVLFSKNFNACTLVCLDAFYCHFLPCLMAVERGTFLVYRSSFAHKPLFMSPLYRNSVHLSRTLSALQHVAISFHVFNSNSGTQCGWSGWMEQFPSAVYIHLFLMMQYVTGVSKLSATLQVVLLLLLLWMTCMSYGKNWNQIHPRTNLVSRSCCQFHISVLRRKWEGNI